MIRSTPFPSALVLPALFLIGAACAGAGEGTSPVLDFSIATENDAVARGRAVPDALPAISLDGASAPGVAAGELGVTGWFVAPCLGRGPVGSLTVGAGGELRLDLVAEGEGPCATAIERWRWTAVVTGLEPGSHDVRVSYDPAVSVEAGADGVVFEGEAEVR